MMKPNNRHYLIGRDKNKINYLDNRADNFSRKPNLRKRFELSGQKFPFEKFAWKLVFFFFFLW